MIEIRNIDNIITKGVLIAEYAIDIYIYIYSFMDPHSRYGYP